MKLYIANITLGRSRPKSDPATTLAADYLERCARYIACEAVAFPSEAALLSWLERLSSRTAPALILLDSRGEQLTSEAFADRLGRMRDSGTQAVVFAIGPHDGWSGAAHKRASLVLSFGRITLPHELARVVCVEQIYRALTILAGHPYHSGH